ncbi:MAG: hypothetical protein GY759_08155 [Chloroflexi bacterium]|nr:hypothetical protein [Chloroflexota bacterium]
MRSQTGIWERAAYGAGGVGGAPPLLSPRHTPGMKPTEEGFIVDDEDYLAGLLGLDF